MAEADLPTPHKCQGAEMHACSAACALRRHYMLAEAAPNTSCHAGRSRLQPDLL